VPVLPRSPRRRRRLAWLGAATAAGAGIAVTAVLLGSPSVRESGPLRTQPASTEPALPPLRVTAARRREIDALVRRFTETAVTRADPAAAWALASAGMRAGGSHAAWERGDIPGVLPYPEADLDRTSWRLVFRSPERIGIDVLVQPVPGTGSRPLVYQVDLVLEAGRLAVDAWAPEASLAVGGPARTVQEPAEAAVVAPRASGRLSARWLLVPAGIFALAVAAAVWVLLRNALRHRRAYRAHREHSGS
jgi:hypothetical protein